MAHSGSIEQLLSDARGALARMDYYGAERCCALAKEQLEARADWPRLVEVLSVLGEARKQRRAIAGAGTIRLGSQDLDKDADAILARVPTGCLVLTQPHHLADARAIQAAARSRRRCVEVLWADNPFIAQSWVIRSLRPESPVSVAVEAPPREWVGRWLDPNAHHRTVPRNGSGLPAPAVRSLRVEVAPADSASPRTWFMEACDRLGDTALEAALYASGDNLVRYRSLLDCLEIVTYHDRSHRRLVEAAQRLGRIG